MEKNNSETYKSMEQRKWRLIGHTLRKKNGPNTKEALMYKATGNREIGRANEI